MTRMREQAVSGGTIALLFASIASAAFSASEYATQEAVPAVRSPEDKVRAIQIDLSLRARSLRAANDRNAWFAEILEGAAQRELRMLSEFEHPDVIADELEAFYGYYRRNLDAWENKTGGVEPHWDQAFTAARDSAPLPFAPITLGTQVLARFPEANAIVIEVIARIRWDLPRALVDGIKRHPQLSIEQTHHDFEKLLPFLEESEERVLIDMPQQQRDFLLAREGPRFLQSNFSRQVCQFDLELERSLALFRAAQTLHQPLSADEYEKELIKRLALNAGTSSYVRKGVAELMSMFDESSRKELSRWLEQHARGCCER